MNQPGDVVNQWSQSAPYWEKHREIICEMFAPLTRALVEDAHVEKGQTVLDVATGPGEPALTVAALVGSQGKVVGIDPVPEMVAAAQRETDRRGLKNVSFQIAFADDLPFAPNMFDAVLSRFGVMFFANPLKGIREMLRVLKPGGRMALAVWHFADNNPFHYILSRAIARHVDIPPVASDAPDPFRFAPRGKLLDVCREAGMLDRAEQLLRFRINAPVSLDDFWALRSEMSDKLRTKLGALSEAQTAQLKREVIDGFRSYSAGNIMSFPAEVLIVRGRKN